MKALRNSNHASTGLFESHEAGAVIEGRPVFDGAKPIGKIKHLLIDAEQGGPILAKIVLRETFGRKPASRQIAWTQLSYDASVSGYRMANQALA